MQAENTSKASALALARHLREQFGISPANTRNSKENDVISIIQSLFACSLQIYDELGNAETAAASFLHSHNLSGDRQLAIDIALHKIVLEHLRKNKHVHSISSEEEDEIITFQPENINELGASASSPAAPCQEYHISFDPLDGSSEFKRGLSVGSIFSIWETQSPLGLQPRKALKAACYTLYSYSLFFAVVLKGYRVLIFKLKPNGELILWSKDAALAEEAGLFSPGNLRIGASRKEYIDYVEDLTLQQKTLRYHGCLVADIHSSLISGSGIFCYPSLAGKKDKLRLLFELMPLAFIIEAAGGLALDDRGTAILDIVPTGLDDTRSFVGGSPGAALHFLKIMNS